MGRNALQLDYNTYWAVVTACDVRQVIRLMNILEKALRDLQQHEILSDSSCMREEV